MRTLVTGATGFLGSHIAERLVQRGDTVRCLVRPTSRTRFLESLGVEFVQGDVTDPESLTPALDGIEVVYHAAALVTDWGPWSDFRAVTITGTRNMLKAASAAGIQRFLHVSTDGVYRYSDLAKGVDETSPYEERFGWLDYYRRAKTAAEKIARRYHAKDRVPVSIVRPALILGERDAAMLPGVMQFLGGSSAAMIGSGKNRLPCVYAGDVADLCIRAATSEQALGEIYNAVSDEYVTQADLYRAVADAAELPMPKRTLPMRAIYGIAAAMEGRARLRGWEHRPDLTRFSVNLLGLSYEEDSSKAGGQLGWKPEVSMREAVERSVEWARSRRREPVSS
jgi:nucleoside-diphosphate-sugar epimerase